MTMLRKTIRVAVIAALVCALAPVAQAAEKTYEGTLVCAKCYLKKADAKECQDVLLVAGEKGATRELYITKNEVWTKSGEACTNQFKATVTGTLSEKDGKTWLTASVIRKS